MAEKKQVIVEEADWQDSKYRTSEWDKTVEVISWEHDYMKKIYIIKYKEKESK